jgi:hypothetical protein
VRRQEANSSAAVGNWSTGCRTCMTTDCATRAPQQVLLLLCRHGHHRCHLQQATVVPGVTAEL